MKRLISVEALGHVVGLLVIASAVHKSMKVEGFDPLPQITAGVSIMSGAWLIPTRKADEALNQAVAPIDRPLTSESKE